MSITVIITQVFSRHNGLKRKFFGENQARFLARYSILWQKFFYPQGTEERSPLHSRWKTDCRAGVYSRRLCAIHSCLRRVSFLFRQERHERTGAGEALTVKSIDSAVIVAPCCPDFKPPSPANPFRPLRVSYTLRDRAENGRGFRFF